MDYQSIKIPKKRTIMVDNIQFTLDEKYEYISVRKYNSIYIIVGKGAYGCVIACKDLYENTNVAIKKINDIFEHHIYALRCLRELKILRLMDHPNIVEIKEILIPEKEEYNDMYVLYYSNIIVMLYMN